MGAHKQFIAYTIHASGKIVRDYRGKKRPVKPYLGKNGYFTVSLWGKLHYLHRIIAEEFIPNPEGKKTVNHKNGVKTDNRILNLEWASYSENNFHAYRTGLKKKASKLSISDVRAIRRLLSLGKQSQAKIAAKFKVCQQTVCNIKSGKRWGNV